MSAIAFFDLDRTLIAINSAYAWVRHERRAGRVGFRDTMRAVVWFGMYRMGRAQLDDVVRKAVLGLEGQCASSFAERTQSFWDSEVEATVRPGAYAALERHRAAGDRLVLLTASSRQLGRAAAEHLGLDDVLSNVFEEEDGLFTGMAREPICYGDGKVLHAEAYAQRHGVELSDCTFYTDSFTDRAALEAVGVPVCIDPDPRLERLARARGWKIEDWGPA